MLLRRQEGGSMKIKKGGGKKWNNFRAKSKGTVMFPNVTAMFCVLEVSKYDCLKTL